MNTVSATQNPQSKAQGEIAQSAAALHEAAPAAAKDSSSRARKPRQGKAGNTAASKETAKKGKGGRSRVAPYKEGSVWSYRVRRNGLDVYETGFEEQECAYEAMNALIKQTGAGAAPLYGGPGKSSLGKAMQRHGLDHLPGLKGAPQAVRRMNRWLKALALPQLAILPVANAHQAPKKTPVRKGRYWAVYLVPHTDKVSIPQGLHAHRNALMSKSADSSRLRQVLAAREMCKVTCADVQRYIQALEAEGLARATVGQEQALLRGLFNHAKKFWHWKGMGENPARGLKLTGELVERERVMSHEEQQRFDEAIKECRVQLHGPAFTLLLETAMRAGEPRNATWGDVDRDSCIITLRTAKGGKGRKVPLSPAALQALHELGPCDDPEAPIFSMTYEALKAAWRRVCERAGIVDLRIHDLRHTSATRLALKTGNIFMVQILTGIATMKVVERYVNVNAHDVVKVMHAPEAAAPAPAAQATQATEQTADAQALMAQLTSLSAQLSAQLAASTSQQPEPQVAGATRARGPAANDAQEPEPQGRSA